MRISGGSPPDVPGATAVEPVPVADVESLLVHQVKPWANTQGVKTRGIYRPGMVVYCQGQWPLRRRTFRDE